MTWTVESTTLVASQVPPIPTSMTPTSTGASANALKAIAVISSKKVTRSADCASTSLGVRDHVVVSRREGLGRDRVAIDADAFGDRLQVR